MARRRNAPRNVYLKALGKFVQYFCVRRAESCAMARQQRMTERTGVLRTGATGDLAELEKAGQRGLPG